MRCAAMAMRRTALRDLKGMVYVDGLGIICESSRHSQKAPLKGRGEADFKLSCNKLSSYVMVRGHLTPEIVCRM
jgi:hypothetical protein